MSDILICPTCVINSQELRQEPVNYMLFGARLVYCDVHASSHDAADMLVAALQLRRQYEANKGRKP
jgi:hypothetical protein